MTDASKNVDAGTAANARIETLNGAFAGAEKAFKPLLDTAAKAAGAAIKRPVEEAIGMRAVVITRLDGSQGVALKICGRDKDLIYELGDDTQILSMITTVLTLYRKVRSGTVHY